MKPRIELLTGVRGGGKTHKMLCDLKGQPENVLLVSRRLKDILRCNEDFKDVKMVLYQDFNREKRNIKRVFIYSLEDYLMYTFDLKDVTAEFNDTSSHYHYTNNFKEFYNIKEDK